MLSLLASNDHGHCCPAPAHEVHERGELAAVALPPFRLAIVLLLRRCRGHKAEATVPGWWRERDLAHERESAAHAPLDAKPGHDLAHLLGRAPRLGEDALKVDAALRVLPLLGRGGEHEEQAHGVVERALRLLVVDGLLGVLDELLGIEAVDHLGHIRNQIGGDHHLVLLHVARAHRAVCRPGGHADDSEAKDDARGDADPDHRLGGGLELGEALLLVEDHAGDDEDEEQHCEQVQAADVHHNVLERPALHLSDERNDHDERHDRELLARRERRAVREHDGDQQLAAHIEHLPEVVAPREGRLHALHHLRERLVLRVPAGGPEQRAERDRVADRDREQREPRHRHDLALVALRVAVEGGVHGHRARAVGLLSARERLQDRRGRVHVQQRPAHARRVEGLEELRGSRTRHVRAPLRAELDLEGGEGRPHGGEDEERAEEGVRHQCRQPPAPRKVDVVQALGREHAEVNVDEREALHEAAQLGRPAQLDVDEQRKDLQEEDDGIGDGADRDGRAKLARVAVHVRRVVHERREAREDEDAERGRHVAAVLAHLALARRREVAVLAVGADVAGEAVAAHAHATARARHRRLALEHVRRSLLCLVPAGGRHGCDTRVLAVADALGALRARQALRARGLALGRVEALDALALRALGRARERRERDDGLARGLEVHAVLRARLALVLALLVVVRLGWAHCADVPLLLEGALRARRAEGLAVVNGVH
mmetsp:Transcript_16075/g.41603  ORF Transcript_16075/g.41603 Transcript_16075/m.41603 type:complete len:719 (+) Transcript_16075:147-2303(+)